MSKKNNDLSAVIVKEKFNWPLTILLILGLITVLFPLYLSLIHI